MLEKLAARAALGVLFLAMSGCMTLARTDAPREKARTAAADASQAPRTAKGETAVSKPSPSPAASKPSPSLPRESAAATKPHSTARVFHRVATGQTLYRIALSYGVSMEEVCRANGISDPGKIQTGQVLVIPRGSLATAVREARDARRKDRENSVGPAPGDSAMAKPPVSASAGESQRPPADSRSAADVVARTETVTATDPSSISQRIPQGAQASSPTGSESRTPAEMKDQNIFVGPLPPDSIFVGPLPLERVAAIEHPSGTGPDAEDLVGPDEAPVGVSDLRVPSDGPFDWPVEGGIVRSPFGLRHGRLHAGLDISAPQGSPVYSSREGTVLYSGHKFRGYGNVVMIDHEDGFVTLYAHNARNLVREGERVARGQVIAHVGATGNATGSHCHFEIRRGDIAIDPGQHLTAPPDALLAGGGAPSRSRPSTVGVSQPAILSPAP